MAKFDSSWDKVAEEYCEAVGETGDINHQAYLNPIVLAILGDVNGKKILDLACGQGYFSRIMARSGADVVGVEISPILVETAKKKEKECPLGIKYIQENSSKMEVLKSNSFDLVVSNMAFHDIAEIESTIKECARVLHRVGRLVFSMSHPLITSSERHRDEKGYYRKAYAYMTPVERTHPMFPKEKGIHLYHRPIGFYVEQLAKNGFVILNMQEVIIPHSDSDPLTRDEEKRMHKNEFPYFMVIEARRE
ncbi:MAG: class I SAM-dependent methyltransferase [Parcubacteria group bacterium]|jgi:2-polyprenyl-3-methyl-5-hydroxy-6-metoxy-1,4-benzoquinol methylase